MTKAYIVVTSLIACTILYLVEQVLTVDYISKTIIKLILFTGIPYIHLVFIEKTNLIKALNLKKFDASKFKLGLIFGVMSFATIIVAYFVFKKVIDLNEIALELQTKSKITSSNFIYVGIYIIFANSFLEEFFFRGYIFLNLFNKGSKKFAYIYSSLLFGIYHIAIFKTWFNPLIVGLALLGLISIGIIFNWLDIKTENFINSWVVHMLADAAIIIVGMIMFNII